MSWQLSQVMQKSPSSAPNLHPLSNSLRSSSLDLKFSTSNRELQKKIGAEFKKQLDLIKETCDGLLDNLDEGDWFSQRSKTVTLLLGFTQNEGPVYLTYEGHVPIPTYEEAIAQLEKINYRLLIHLREYQSSVSFLFRRYQEFGQNAEYFGFSRDHVSRLPLSLLTDGNLEALESAIETTKRSHVERDEIIKGVLEGIRDEFAEENEFSQLVNNALDEQKIYARRIFDKLQIKLKEKLNRDKYDEFFCRCKDALDLSAKARVTLVKNVHITTKKIYSEFMNNHFSIIDNALITKQELIIQERILLENFFKSEIIEEPLMKINLPNFYMLRLLKLRFADIWMKMMQQVCKKNMTFLESFEEKTSDLSDEFREKLILIMAQFENLNMTLMGKFRVVVADFIGSFFGLENDIFTLKIQVSKELRSIQRNASNKDSKQKILVGYEISRMHEFLRYVWTEEQTLLHFLFETLHTETERFFNNLNEFVMNFHFENEQQLVHDFDDYSLLGDKLIKNFTDSLINIFSKLDPLQNSLSASLKDLLRTSREIEMQLELLRQREIELEHIRLQERIRKQHPYDSAISSLISSSKESSSSEENGSSSSASKRRSGCVIL